MNHAESVSKIPIRSTLPSRDVSLTRSSVSSFDPYNFNRYPKMIQKNNNKN